MSRGSRGSIAILGRTLHYKVKSGFYSWKYQHRGEAWDQETQIRAESKRLKGESGARKHALTNLVKKLKDLGHLK